MAKIDKVTLQHSNNYGIYDNCDSATDYFHYTGGRN